MDWGSLLARNEKRITLRIQRWLKDQDKSYFFKVAGQASQLTGISDLIGVYRGRFVAIEVKDPANTAGPTPRQKLFMSRVKAAGGVAFVARDLDKVKRIIDAITPKEEES